MAVWEAVAMVSRREHDACARFADRYREERVDVVQTIERAVIGGDWGANGYTTADQADRIAELLGLGASSLLLDVGAGRGWPGLYLAARTGCSVVLSDVPIEGLNVAAARSRTEGLSARALCVNASARDNPFRDERFDAVVHTDVLC
jgi:2-polyprenyl-3-methyl-5-hydroxy-6-metoxy-1,4-benzoquinol methylase